MNKANSEPKVTFLQDSKEVLMDFIKYLDAFYGENGIYAEDLNGGFSYEQLTAATLAHAYLSKGKEWGGGDSLDRERVRTLLELYLPE